MKTWVNLYSDCYDKKQFYVSKSYSTKKIAVASIRKSMVKRYIKTVNLKELLGKKKQTTNGNFTCCRNCYVV